jgi:hypothetical protein
VRDIGVGEGGAEARYRLDVAQGVDHRRLHVAQHSEHVVDVRRQPRALRGKIEGAKLARDPGIRELEGGMEVDHAVIPVELAAIDHDGHGGGEEGLGERTDLKHGAGVDRHAAVLAAHAEALGIDEAVAGDDADGEAGHVVGLHPALDVGFESGDQCGYACFHRRAGLGRLLCPCDIRQLQA